MNWWSRLWSGISLPSPPISIETKIALMLQRHLTPCFSFTRSAGLVKEYFLVLSSDGEQINGLNVKTLTEFSAGTETLYTYELDEIKWVDPDEVFGNNGANPHLFRRAIEMLADGLCYDRRVKVFTNRFGVDFYVSGGFNYNTHGFTVEVPCDAEWCHSGWIAGFVHYAAVPYYQGNWYTNPVEEDKPNFVYYDWMGDRISGVRLQEKRARDHENLALRFQKNMAQRKILDADLADIIQRLNKTHVHE